MRGAVGAGGENPLATRLARRLQVNNVDITVTSPIYEYLDLAEHVQEMQSDSLYFL
jgi:hypothetical protein